MATKEEVFNLLAENSDGFVSGQQIAERLGISRTAVWKAIRTLEQNGCRIEAVTNKGYRLMKNADVPDPSAIESALQAAGIRIKVFYMEETGSTNEDAARLLKGYTDPVLVIAGRQTRGRGRRGRDFYSPAGSGLYMSIAIPGAAKLIKTVKVTATAAVAVSEAIDETVFAGKKTSLIKWVNDIYIDDRKVCGILTEAHMPMEDEDDGCVIIGMGVNVYEPSGGFPEDISKKAGSLIRDKSAAAEGELPLRTSLAVCIVRKLFYYMNEQAESLRIYRERSNLIGSRVIVNSFAQTDNAQKSAKVLYIDDECGLVVEYENGQKETLTSGEVSVIRC